MKVPRNSTEESGLQAREFMADIPNCTHIALVMQTSEAIVH